MAKARSFEENPPRHIKLRPDPPRTTTPFGRGVVVRSADDRRHRRRVAYRARRARRGNGPRRPRRARGRLDGPVPWAGGRAGRPGSSAEVGEALRACAAGVGVVPQGNNTGLVAGAVPHDAVVLSTTRLASIGEVDPVAGVVTAGAGVTLEAVQAPPPRQACRSGRPRGARRDGRRHDRHRRGRDPRFATGRCAGRSWGSRRSWRTEPWCAREQAARRPQAWTWSRSCPAARDARRHHGARLRLVPSCRSGQPPRRARRRRGRAVAATAHARSRPELEAVELVDAACLALAASRAGQPVPFDGQVRCSSLKRLRPGRCWTISRCAAVHARHARRRRCRGPGTAPAVGATRGRDRGHLVRRVPHKLDVGLPLGGTGSVCRRSNRRSRASTGMLASSSSATCPRQPARQRDRPGTRGRARRRRRPAPRGRAHGGAIAAEHGIGRAKARWLGLARSQEELAVHAAIKRALDPGGLLNPGVLDASAGWPDADYQLTHGVSTASVFPDQVHKFAEIGAQSCMLVSDVCLC